MRAAGVPSLVQLSGGLALPLVVLGAVALALALSAGRRVRTANRHADELLQRVALLGRDGRLDDARRVAHETPGPVADVVLAGLDSADPEASLVAMRTAAGAARARLGAGIRLLDWTGALAVLLPGVALVVGTDDVAALAALALGLSLAIAVALARWALVAGVRRAALDMERATGIVVGILRDGAASR